MPRYADHAARRRQITDAVRRVLSREGNRSPTFQSVATEAGVSVRLVQYYFGDKAELLRATQRAVLEDAGDRIRRRFAAHGAEAQPRVMIRDLISEVLPVDDQRRADHVVLAALHAMALDPAGEETVSAEISSAAPRALAILLAAPLEHAAQENRLAGIDPRWDGEILLAATAGLAQGILSGHYSERTALELVDRLVDRLLR